MISYFKKRTDEEIKKSLDDYDFTGGYKFLPWLIRTRKIPTISFFLNLFLGYKCFEGFGTYDELMVIIAGGFFGVLVPFIIAGILVNEYKNLKDGISS